MSLENKREELNKITDLFNNFLEHMGEVGENVDKQKTYTEGYMACMSDILSMVQEDIDNPLLESIKTRISMDARKEVMAEISEGLVNLKNAYSKALKEA